MDRKRYAVLRLKQVVYRFFFPEMKRGFFLRLLVLALSVTLLLLLFKPCFISGSSMEPNYHDNGFTFSFRWRYLLVPPARGDVVTISYFGRKQLLKRVIALPGEKVGFADGKILVNGLPLDEPYVKYPGTWNTEPVTVRPGHCFVVGDNREQDKSEHLFGEVSLKRITGGPLF
ncbi:MAG: signal peptidase I [Lentisphaeria bacterium]|nr:signal peptidase I [Lentisphaeria bacterium]